MELDLLETVIDRAEDTEQVPSRQELEEVNKIVLAYIVKHKLLMYGGTAIDAVLKYKVGDGIYGPSKLPDYDFITKDNVKDAMELANILVKQNYRYVAVNQAQHGNTMRVKVNFAPEPSADLTYYPPIVFKHVPYKEIKGVRYVSPEYMRIDFYKSFTNPNNYYRWLTKDEYIRYRKLVDVYPLKFVEMKYKSQPKGVTSRMREIHNLLNSYDRSIIWAGIFAFNMLAKVMDSDPVFINYLEAYIPDANKVANELVEVVGKGYGVVQFAPLIDHYPSISMIVYNKRPIVCLYELSGTDFIPTIGLEGRRFVSYHQLLLFFHIKRLQSAIWKDDYYHKLAMNLIYRLNHEREDYLNKNNLIGIEKGMPLSIFDFDFNNMPVSEAHEDAIESYYGTKPHFRYYPDKKMTEPITDFDYKVMDGLPLK